MPDAHKNFAYSTIASVPSGTTDNFDRADSNVLGGTWVESENAVDALRILSNQLRVTNRPAGAALNRGFATFTTSPADQFAQLVFKAKVGAAQEAKAGVCVRGAGTHNSFTGYALLYGDNAGGVTGISIVKFVAVALDAPDGFAGKTILGTFAVTLAVNDVLKLEVVGTALKAFVNGVERISVTDAAVATGDAGVVCHTWFAIDPGAQFNTDWDSWETGAVIQSVTVAAGHGARFPAAPFNATVWPVSVQPTVDNAEIVRVTARTTDTLTISRAQEGTTQRTILVGDQIAATITAKTLTDAETGGATVLRSEAITWKGTTAAVSATGEQQFRDGLNDFMRTGFAIPTDYSSGVLTYKVFLRAGGGFGGVRLSRDRYRLRSGFDFLQQEAGVLSTLVFADTATDSAEAIYTFTVPAADFAAGDLVLFDLTRLGADAADVNPSTIFVDGVIVEYLATG